MTVVLRIDEVPDEVHDALTKEARRRTQSLQAYLLDLVEREARALRGRDRFEPTKHLRVALDVDPVDVVREGRDGGFDVDRQRSGSRSTSSGPPGAATGRTV